MRFLSNIDFLIWKLEWAGAPTQSLTRAAKGVTMPAMNCYASGFLSPLVFWVWPARLAYDRYAGA